MTRPLLMTHMIPYFPNRELSKDIALTMLEHNAHYLEVQFPFTDPSADGPLIEQACHRALDNGFTVDSGFEFIREIKNAAAHFASTDKKIFVMSYASIIITRGVEQFIDLCAQSGVNGIIVPDLPIDYDEGVLVAARSAGIECIPVLAVNASANRIAMIHALKPKYLYCALRVGITGNKTTIDKRSVEFLQSFKDTNIKILGGFGISEHAQIETIKHHIHAAVVGSAFIRDIEALKPPLSSALITHAVATRMKQLQLPQ